MTPHAFDVVRRVTGHPRLTESSGLRIAGGDAAGSPLQVSAAPAPRPGDEVVERDGARIFLEPEASLRVRGRLLDAVTEWDGKVHFVLVRHR